MSGNYAFIVIYTVIAATIYWSIPARWVDTRKWSLAMLSAAFVVYLDPNALPLLLWNSLVVYGFGRIAETTGRQYATAIALVIAPLVLVRVFGGQFDIPIVIGLSFSVLRSAGAINEWHKTKTRCSPVECVLINVFFPVVLSGPVLAVRTVQELGVAQRLRIHDAIECVGRISLGFFKIVFIGADLVAPFNNYLRDRLLDGQLDPIFLIPFGILNAVYIYLNFSGFCDIAVGVGHAFGVTLPENFRWPLFANNLQVFWQRWHLTLGTLVNRTIYLPLVRNTGRVYFAIFATFVTIGLWHAFTLGYLLWGLAHGAGLALVRYWGKRSKRWKWAKRVAGKPMTKLVTMTITLTYVGIVSAIANAPSVTDWFAVLPDWF